MYYQSLWSTRYRRSRRTTKKLCMMVTWESLKCLLTIPSKPSKTDTLRSRLYQKTSEKARLTAARGQFLCMGLPSTTLSLTGLTNSHNTPNTWMNLLSQSDVTNQSLLLSVYIVAKVNYHRISSRKPWRKISISLRMGKWSQRSRNKSYKLDKINRLPRNHIEMLKSQLKTTDACPRRLLCRGLPRPCLKLRMISRTEAKPLSTSWLLIKWTQTTPTYPLLTIMK